MENPTSEYMETYNKVLENIDKIKNQDNDEYMELLKEFDYFIDLADTVYVGIAKSVYCIDDIDDIVITLQHMCSISFVENKCSQIYLSNYLNNALFLAKKIQKKINSNSI